MNLLILTLGGATMEFFEIISKRRSVRNFKNKAIPEEYIKKIIAAATMAPSGGNMQPWEFFVIREGEIKKQIVSATYTGYDTTGPPQHWIESAPLIILVCVDQKRPASRYGKEGKTICLLDAGCAIENILLAVTALGLGACVVTGFRKDEVKTILNLSENIQPVALIPVGYPKEIPDPPYRLPLEEVVHII